MPAYRLSAAAELDILILLHHTHDNFGETARQRYELLLVASLRDVAADPERPGSIAWPEFGPEVRSYHLRHSRNHVAQHRVQRPRHLLLYRVGREFIGIGRILHDAMELKLHLPSRYGNE